MRPGFIIMTLKQNSSQWSGAILGSPTPKKPRGEKSSQKMLATVFWDIHGIICIEFLPRGSTIDSDRYIQTLKKLKARIYRARPALEMQRVLFHHDNAPPHTSGKTRETIASMGWKTLPHPPYSPDLAPSDYWIPPVWSYETTHEGHASWKRRRPQDNCYKMAPRAATRVLPARYTGPYWEVG